MNDTVKSKRLVRQSTLNDVNNEVITLQAERKILQPFNLQSILSERRHKYFYFNCNEMCTQTPDNLQRITT